MLSFCSYLHAFFLDFTLACWYNSGGARNIYQPHLNFCLRISQQTMRHAYKTIYSFMLTDLLRFKETSRLSWHSKAQFDSGITRINGKHKM